MCVVWLNLIWSHSYYVRQILAHLETTTNFWVHYSLCWTYTEATDQTHCLYKAILMYIVYSQCVEYYFIIMYKCPIPWSHFLFCIPWPYTFIHTYGQSDISGNSRLMDQRSTTTWSFTYTEATPDQTLYLCSPAYVYTIPCMVYGHKMW